MDEPLVVSPMPSLVSVLVRSQRAKGSPLTEAEVLAARDGAASVALPLSVAEEVWRKRGYGELHLDRVWESWQLFLREYGPAIDGMFGGETDESR